MFNNDELLRMIYDSDCRYCDYADDVIAMMKYVKVKGAELDLCSA